MRKKIIFVFIILLSLQALQVGLVSRFIRQHQSAVSNVTKTVEGREVVLSLKNAIEQIRDNTVAVAGMNFPVMGIKKLDGYWEYFEGRIQTVQKLAQNIGFDSALLFQLKESFTLADEQRIRFKAIILSETRGEDFVRNMHDSAFDFDEALAEVSEVVNMIVAKFLAKEAEVVAYERQIHDLPIQAATSIGIIIAIILILFGIFSVFKIVNPLITLTIQYRIAERKLRREREMSLALEKAQAVAQAKSDFLANMSHELRTPMNAILGFSELLTKTELNEQQKRYLGLVLNSGSHLIQIINDILDFSKLESGKISLEYVDFDLEELVNDVMKTMKVRIRENPLDIYVDYSPDAIRIIKSDPTRLKQVLVNLVGNSIKFTKQGEVGIIVRKEKNIECKSDEEAVRISVKDSGIGIPQEKLNGIFEAFVQADESTTREFGGTGLGLSISKAIVETMGGRIWIESEVGKGSLFSFILKFQNGQLIKKLKADPAAQDCLKGKKVFIIDDNPVVRKLNEKVASSIGLDVLGTADSGRAALAKLDDLVQNKLCPDILLCDIMMEEMDGYEIARRVKDNDLFKTTKVIALTAQEEAGISKHIQDKCFDGYLHKPVSNTELIEALACQFGYQKHEVKDQSEEQDSEDFSGLRVLVVEDSVPNQMLMKAYFEPLKCSVDYVSNGLEACQRLEARNYDLCLMDIQMPVMGGIEATQKIRESITREMPIIALTAAIMKEDREKAQDVGF
jgi:signal transduction histidine kinase/DNA-binding response OmpR family regulator